MARTPHIVALHGFTGSGEDFEALPLPLDAPDLPGHGKNAGLPCTLEAVEALITLRPDSVLLGYSMGARIALHLALRRSPRALVLLSGSPGLASEEERAARRAADEALDAGSPDFADRWEQTPILRSQAKIPAPFGERLRARRRQNAGPGLAAALRGLGTGALPSLWGELPRISMPALLITGALDTKFCSINAAMAAAMPRARHAVIPGVGHTAHLEAPGEVAARIEDFLAELEDEGLPVPNQSPKRR